MTALHHSSTATTSTSNGEQNGPRLEPIEHPSSWKLRLAYWLTRKQLGKVITPMKVINARMPKSLRLSYEMNKLEGELSLAPALRFLIKRHVAGLNGCSFCVDIAEADALSKEVDIEKAKALPDFRSSEAFSERERAALAYCEEATQEKAVRGDTFETLRQHFTEQEIAEITWLNAMENYYNLLNRPLQIGSDALCELAQNQS